MRPAAAVHELRLVAGDVHHNERRARRQHDPGARASVHLKVHGLPDARREEIVAALERAHGVPRDEPVGDGNLHLRSEVHLLAPLAAAHAALNQATDALANVGVTGGELACLACVLRLTSTVQADAPRRGGLRRRVAERLGRASLALTATSVKLFDEAAARAHGARTFDAVAVIATPGGDQHAALEQALRDAYGPAASAAANPGTTVRLDIEVRDVGTPLGALHVAIGRLSDAVGGHVATGCDLTFAAAPEGDDEP